MLGILGRDLSNVTALFLWGNGREEKRRKFIEKLKIPFSSLAFFFLLLPFFVSSNPSVNVSASSWYAPRWNVEAIPLKSSSSQNYHFISTPARKRRAGPLLTALGILLFIVCKLWRNIVAWENVLCGWWKWAVGATTKGEIRPIFSVGGTHKSENNAHYYRKNNIWLLGSSFRNRQEVATEAKQPTSWPYLGKDIIFLFFLF